MTPYLAMKNNHFSHFIHTFEAYGVGGVVLSVIQRICLLTICCRATQKLSNADTSAARQHWDDCRRHTLRSIAIEEREKRSLIWISIYIKTRLAKNAKNAKNNLDVVWMGLRYRTRCAYVPDRPFGRVGRYRKQHDSVLVGPVTFEGIW